jgi:hypothetical protein
MKRIAAVVLVAAMLTVAVPATGALGETWRERKQTFVSRRENFKSTYEIWESAREDLRNAIEAGAPPSEIRAKARIVAILAYHLRLSYLRHLRARAEATRGLAENDRDAIVAELDIYISTIVSYGENIRAEENWQNKRAIIRELRDYWQQIRARVKQITAQLILAGFRAMVERAEAFAARIEAKIEELKENGENTDALEAWLEDFTSHIENAKDRLENAEAIIQDDTLWENVGFRDIFRAAVAHVRRAVEYLRNAFRELRRIVVDIRLRDRTITLTGSGTFKGRGSGTVDINLEAGMVRIWIWDVAENSTVIVSSNANITGFEEYERTELENENKIQFKGTGYGKVTGHDITVHISTPGNAKDEMSIHAAGTGTLTATGTGWYRTFGENRYMAGEITPEGMSVTLATGEVGGQ